MADRASRLGKRQLSMLMALGRIGSTLMSSSRVSRSLERRGLIYAGRITPAGLRVLAGALESGRLDRDCPARHGRYWWGSEA